MHNALPSFPFLCISVLQVGGKTHLAVEDGLLEWTPDCMKAAWILHARLPNSPNQQASCHVGVWVSLSPPPSVTWN